jgi:hypothetical protein
VGIERETIGKGRGKKRKKKSEPQKDARATIDTATQRFFSGQLRTSVARRLKEKLMKTHAQLPIKFLKCLKKKKKKNNKKKKKKKRESPRPSIHNARSLFKHRSKALIIARPMHPKSPPISHVHDQQKAKHVVRLALPQRTEQKVPAKQRKKSYKKGRKSMFKGESQIKNMGPAHALHHNHSFTIKIR